MAEEELEKKDTEEVLKIEEKPVEKAKVIDDNFDDFK